MAKINLSIIHNRLKRATSKHEVSVELCFCAKRQRKYFSTGVKVTTTQWSDASKMVIKRKDADELNEIIQAYRTRANEIISKMVKECCCDLNVIISQMNGEDEGNSFIEYCERRRNERKVCEHTKKRYDVFIKFLKTWGKIKSFQDCNVSKVRAMDEYLHRQDKAQCTIYDYHKYLKLFINDAMIDGLIEQNPYKFLPFHIGKGEKQYVDCVTEEQFAAIKKLKLSTPHILHARDLFLFQCYTGLAYSDLASFNYGNCEEIGGKMFYHAKRTKTDTDFVFQLLKPALEILQKYDFKLPRITNQKYNDYLKAIGQMVGVDRLHTHMGRATAATLFLSKGMPINIVARVLGHTTLRQTTRYARTLNKDVQSAFDALEGKM
ncbi:site-specific integrase [Segatella copri]|uniref:Site-specific integrase n=1 Tax=Segatella copri TaxID=165179 RepID=A0A3E5E8Z5_9BACT|nr:site-specific integrase [Segatella copri]RGN85455.1 site-specific integrase [Segatella copri]RGS17950.1 site-specific integrase [Segatella copri]